MKKFFVPTIIFLLIVAGTILYWDYSQDDVYITYRYSRNIALGNGFVFNPGERVQGTTTPLFALIMAGVYFITHNLAHAGNLISALSLLGVCLITMQLGNKFGGAWLGAGAALMLAINTWFYISFGMETLTYTLLLIAAFWFAYHNQDFWAGVCVGLLTITRADGILAAGALAITALIARKRIPWKGGITAAIIIAAWYFFAWSYFGSPLPQTFSAKVGLFSGITFIADGIEWFQHMYLNGSPLYLIALILWIVGAIASARERSFAFVLCLWSIIYLGGYTALNVSAFWYYPPLLPAMVITMGYGAMKIARWIQPRQIRIAASALVLVLLLAGQARTAVAYSGAPTRIATYRIVGEWLAQHAPKDSLVLVGDLGVVSWYSDLPTIDVPGLVVPTMYVHTETYAIQKFKPTYIVATQYWAWKAIVNESWLIQDYERVTQISSKGDADFSPMIIFRRRPPQPSPSANEESKQFGQAIKFSGTSKIEGVYWSGGEITLEAQWAVTRETKNVYAAFFHLVDLENQIVAQSDAWIGRDAPTNTRQVGASIADRYSILLPPDLVEGKYKLIVGVYDTATGAREKLADGSESVEIKNITIRFPGGSGLP